MLPVKAEAIDEKIKNLEKIGVENLLLDAPTLYESGEDGRCDAVIAVLAREEIRAGRIKARDNLTPDQLASRLKATKPDEFYKNRTKYIIYNNGDLLDLKGQATTLLQKFMEM